MSDENQESQKVSNDAKAMMAFEAEKKSVGIAYILWFLLGFIGIHRFYAGKAMSGAIMLGLWLLSLVLSLVYIGVLGFVVLGIWWIVDAFLLNGIITRYNQSVMQRVTA